MTQTIPRAALGRVGQIGSLYNITSDDFIKDNLFCSELKEDAIESYENPETTVEYTTSNTFKEKSKILGACANLQISILAGFVQPLGIHANYLKEKNVKMSSKLSGSLVYTIQTKCEEVYIRGQKDAINIEENSQSKEATHVVVGITWGGTCIITCAEKDESTEEMGNKEEKEKVMKMIFKTFKDLLSKKREMKDYSSGLHNLSFTCKMDAALLPGGKVTTLEGVINTARQFPDLLKKSTEGKGVPLVYHLLPLKRVVNICKLDIRLERLYQEIEEDIVEHCIRKVEEMNQLHQEICDMKEVIKATREFFPLEVFRGIETIDSEFKNDDAKFKLELKKLLKEVKCQQAEDSKLVDFMNDSKVKQDYQEKIQKFYKDSQHAKVIIEFKGKGILCENEVIKVDLKKVDNAYVFRPQKKEEGMDDRNYLNNKHYFMRLHQDHHQDKHYKFIVLFNDKKIYQKLVVKSRISYYKNGHPVCEDVYAKEKKHTQMNLVKVEKRDKLPIIVEPKRYAFVKIKCPKEECGLNPKSWRCFTCMNYIYYSEDWLYCNCGKFRAESSTFRCNEVEHGINFIKYPQAKLDAELGKLRAMGEKVILILGETGVGKSTWINGLINYLQFSSLKEAAAAPDLQVLIPTQFTFTRDGKSKNIKVGDEQKSKPGESDTQVPTAYVCKIGDCKIRLIDTPGIGCTVGIEQDKENFTNILSYLSYFTEIHAVCILLKSNESRMNLMFRFCIQELLTHLHKSLKENIVFCFTHTRATHYEPGDTLTVLNKELREKEIGIKAIPSKYFCFDSESFRLLACLKNGVRFVDEEMNDYAKSWNKSVKETTRLFEYIDGLEPHKTNKTISLNDARRLIIDLQQPLNHVTSTNVENIEKTKELKDKIQSCDEDIEELKKLVNFKQWDIEYTPLDFHRLVCTDKKCAETVQVEDEEKTHYKQICCKRCWTYIARATPDVVGHKGLWWCRKFNFQGICKKCGHSCDMHMLIDKETSKFEKEFFSQEKQNELNECLNKKELKEKMLKETEETLKEYEEEKDIIIKVASKFASFLKENALLRFNDALLDYLEYCIRLEEEKPEGKKSTDYIHDMEKALKKYDDEKAILENKMENADRHIITPEEVDTLVHEELFKLKHTGETLRKNHKKLTESRLSNIKFNEIPFYTSRETSFTDNLAKLFSRKKEESK